MNELTFRKQLQVNPYQLNDDMLAYLQAHPEHKSLVQKVRAFDKQIEEVLDVEIPEGLHARILLNQSYQDAAEESHVSDAGNETPAVTQMSEWKKMLNGSWLGLSAMAASLIVVAVSLNLWLTPPKLAHMTGTDLVAHITDHIQEDPSLMTAVKLPKTEADMQRLFATVGASLQQPVDSMSYAGACVINGQQGLHIVMQDEQGPITVIVMPGQQLAAMEAFQSSQYQGELIPVKGGVVAIVANSMEQVAIAQIRFFKAVKFA